MDGFERRWLGVAFAVVLGGCSSGETVDTAADLRPSLDAEVGSKEGVVGPEVPENQVPDADWRPQGDLDLVATDILSCEPPRAEATCPCHDNTDCASGWCVLHQGAPVCTKTCVEECPDGFTCVEQKSGTDTVFVCISDFPTLCLPCDSNAACEKWGGGRCIPYGQLQDPFAEQSGSFCAGPCDGEKTCPAGHKCELLQSTDGDEKTHVCVLQEGECACSSFAREMQMQTPCSKSNDQGTCSGWRTCTTGGLSPCDANEALDEACNGQDDDCDGLTDDAAPCDDSNECTQDSCQAGGCLHDAAAAGTECMDDGNECTSDLCDAKTCTHPPLSGIPCADGSFCTTDDLCVDGLCAGKAVDCNDDNPCTDDSCDPASGCKNEPNSSPCEDDGNLCTADVCLAGLCQHPSVEGTVECAEDADPCTLDVCAGGACAHPPGNDDSLCDDADICTLGDHCKDGKCVYNGFDDENKDCIPCGNCICQLLENFENCPVDCGYCGDGICGCKENGPDGTTCPKDCLTACGNGICEPGETPSSCQVDCGGCGDAFCGLNETHASCPGDCKPGCGNGQCEEGEEEEAENNGCPADCSPVCGNKLCSPGENAISCPQDCASCGDGICGMEEMLSGSCDLDCKAACGNGLCQGGEDYKGCPVDCGYCGDKVCGQDESGGLCFVDCQEGCGDKLCQAEFGENWESCPIDCKDDLDGDGKKNLEDNCPHVPNQLQTDLDLDGLGDACDPDDDGDGENDASDCAPQDPAVSHKAIEICDGLDNNCDGVADAGADCSDNVVCTEDSCQGAGGCIHAPNDGLCDDSDVCTEDLCAAGAGCLFPPGNDGAPCLDLPQHVCQSGECVCVPVCLGKACGPDGCGGTCGSCPDGLPCHEGECVQPGKCYLDEHCAFIQKEHCCLKLYGACDLAVNKCRDPQKDPAAFKVGPCNWKDQCFLEHRNEKLQASPGTFHCVAQGEAHPAVVDGDLSCLMCNPASPHVWTPGMADGKIHCFIDLAADPTTLGDQEPVAVANFPWQTGECVPQAKLPPAGNPADWEHPDATDSPTCWICDPKDYASRYAWAPAPELAPPWTGEKDPNECADPHFLVTDAEGNNSWSPLAPYSGTTYGRCSSGVCTGLSWQWGVFSPAVSVHQLSIDGEATTFHGAMGGPVSGGFGHYTLGP
jgi:hypothetical protein